MGVDVLISLFVLILIVGLVWYLLTLLPLPPPWKVILEVLLIIIVILILLYNFFPGFHVGYRR